MEVYNFGSLNIDNVYSVDHFVQPGETMSSEHYQVCCGGKGLNQSIAVARAGGSIHHLGVYGQGGEFLLEYLQNNGVDTAMISKFEKGDRNPTRNQVEKLADILELDKNILMKILLIKFVSHILQLNINQ